MNNKVKFLRGTSGEYAVAEKDSDTIYFTTDDGKLYIGDKEVSGDGSITIDDTLSDTSTNPVQNKVVKQAIDNKADKTTATTDTDGLMSAVDKTKLDNADDTYALKSKYGDTTIDVGRKAGTIVGHFSTAEGQATTASSLCSHAEGDRTTASGSYSHSEGEQTKAIGAYSHAEGCGTEANGKASHAEGRETTAFGDYSHTSGYYTKALHENEAAYGKYNESNEDTLFSIGDGTADDARHNAFEITTDGGKLHDKDIAVKDDIINPNLLTNPDFAINQRGNTGITINNSTWKDFFIADRWKLYINNATPAGTIQRNDDGTITLSMTTAYCDIRQMFENSIEAGYYTLSAKINGEIRTLSGYFTGESELIDNNKGLVLGSTYFGVRCPEGSTITVKWAKLEKGKIVTNFTSPNIAEEMPKCLRYFETLTYGTTSGLPAVMWKNDTNICHTNVPIFEKRNGSNINPTVTISGDEKRFVSNIGVFSISNYSISSYATNNLGIQFTLASAPTEKCFGWVDKFIVTIDAEV